MKERISIRRFMARLWTTFPAAAALCIVIAAIGITAEWGMEASSPALAWLDTAVQACVSGLCFAVLGSLISRYYRWPKWLCWIFAAVGIGLSLLIGLENGMVYSGVCVAAVALCFHYACGHENRSQRLAQIGGNFLGSLGLSICLFAALRLCTYAVSSLFFVSYWQLGVRLGTMVSTIVFFVAAPWLFLGRLPDETDDPESRGGFRKVTANLFLPFYLVLVGILLGYIVMILIRWEMPVGQMNGLALTAMSLYAIFHLTLNGEENRISRWFTHWGAWLMLPVIVVQQVGVWMRYDAYGLTPARYAGMLITLLLVVTVAWGLCRKRANWFFVGAAVLAVVLLVSPLNVNQVARWNQETRLKNALEACGMLDEEGNIVPNADADTESRKIILSAADYLYWREDVPEDSFTYQYQQQRQNGDAYLSDLEMFGFREEDQSQWQMFYANGTDSGTELNVSGYRYAKRYYHSAHFDDETEVSELLVPAQQLMDAADWEQETILQEEFPLPDGTVLRVTQLTLNNSYGEPNSLSVQGWILTPEE